MWYRSDSPRAGEPVQKRRDRPDGEVQPVARPGRIRLACGRDETGDMRFLLDHLAAVVAADVARDVLHAGDHQDCRGTREQRQRAAHLGVRNRVEAHGVLPDTTVRIASNSKGCAGSG
jgi:hypothetical protein